MMCPLEIIAEFLKRSNDNTFKSVETCAILAGEERQGQLYITTLIFPKQTGSHDQCSMVDEVELFETQIEKSVMTLGWIHTHPKFVSFSLTAF
jgi:STAM-binding protein